MIVGTAGHIDHGKTALVKALTGVDTDRLQEEKARGITIDLGFAYKRLSGGSIMGFVDVPGHEKFIHNMLAGITGIDYALLVIAANDGPMPQTLEHIAILNVLGMPWGIVALTKTDLVTPQRVAEVTELIGSILSGTGLAGWPVIPVSVKTGEGVVHLAECLETAASRLPQRDPMGYFRLAVDRSFTLSGIGTVVTGTVFSGTVAQGDNLIVSPSGISVRVRGVHAQNQSAKEGRQGERCALNLAGTQLEKNDIKRGDWIVAPPIHAPTARLDAWLMVLPSERKPLLNWTPVHLHLAASDIPSRIAVLQGQQIYPGGVGLVQLVLDRPIGALRGDRYVIRDQSAQRTVGGGEILDPFPPVRGRREAQRLAMLSAMSMGTPKRALESLLDTREAGVDLTHFELNWNLTEPEKSSLRKEVPLIRVELPGGAIGFAPRQWRMLRDRTLHAIRDHQCSHPDHPGVTLQCLHQMLSENLSMPVLAALVNDLTAEKLAVREGTLLHLPGHQPLLSDPDRVLRDAIVSHLHAAGLNAPRVKELAVHAGANEKVLRDALRRLVRTGELYQVSEDYYFASDAIQDLAASAQRLASQDSQGIVNIGQLREVAGIGRNRLIEILEFFDRQGFTMRVPHGRRVRRDGASVFGDRTRKAGIAGHS